MEDVAAIRDWTGSVSLPPEKTFRFTMSKACSRSESRQQLARRHISADSLPMMLVDQGCTIERMCAKPTRLPSRTSTSALDRETGFNQGRRSTDVPELMHLVHPYGLRFTRHLQIVADSRKTGECRTQLTVDKHKAIR